MADYCKIRCIFGTFLAGGWSRNKHENSTMHNFEYVSYTPTHHTMLCMSGADPHSYKKVIFTQPDAFKEVI